MIHGIVSVLFNIVSILLVYLIMNRRIKRLMAQAKEKHGEMVMDMNRAVAANLATHDSTLISQMNPKHLEIIRKRNERIEGKKQTDPLKVDTQVLASA